MSIGAGRLNRRIEIRRPVETDLETGGSAVTWATVCSCSAEVKGLDGRESVMDRVLQGISVYQVRIRWRDGLLPSDQIRLGATNLNIRSIADPDGRRRELIIMADTASTR